MSDITKKIAMERDYYQRRNQKAPNLLVMHPAARADLDQSDYTYRAAALEYPPRIHHRFMGMLVCTTREIPGGFVVAYTDQELPA